MAESDVLDKAIGLDSDKLRSDFKKAASEVLGLPRLEGDLNILRSENADLASRIEKAEQVLEQIKKAIGV